jgi:membrane-bound inhibitor of C-type lysozyme
MSESAGSRGPNCTSRTKHQPPSAAATVATTTAGVGAHPGGFSGPSGSGGGGSNARSGPAAGGSIGTVSSLSGSGFTLVTSAGQKATVKETSSTTYEHGTTPASASAVNDGETALVLGTTDSTTITATQVITQPAPGGSDASSQVVPFKRGASSTSKTVGQIPSNYRQGSGTIASGATANKATEAALAAYPGGIVDRVVRLSNGEYEVHNIGVNWPHHIFVNTDFKVVGAD